MFQGGGLKAQSAVGKAWHDLSDPDKLKYKRGNLAAAAEQESQPSEEALSTLHGENAAPAGLPVASVSVAAPDVVGVLTDARKLEEGAAKVQQFMSESGQQVQPLFL